MSHVHPAGDDRNDEALLRAVAQGDTAALAALYDRHAGWLLARLAGSSARPSTTNPCCRRSPGRRAWLGRFLATRTSCDPSEVPAL